MLSLVTTSVPCAGPGAIGRKITDPLRSWPGSTRVVPAGSWTSQTLAPLWTVTLFRSTRPRPTFRSVTAMDRPSCTATC
jgi:hypothetical protein